MTATKTFTLYRVSHNHDSNGEPIASSDAEAFKQLVSVASSGEKPLCFRIDNEFYKDIEEVCEKIDEHDKLVVYSYSSIKATVRVIIPDAGTEEFSEVFSNETIEDLLPLSLPKVREEYRDCLVSRGVVDYKNQLASANNAGEDAGLEALSDEHIKELVENIADKFLSIVFSPACYPRFKVGWSEERDGTHPLSVSELVADHLDMETPVVTICLPKRPTAESTTVDRFIIPA